MRRLNKEEKNQYIEDRMKAYNETGDSWRRYYNSKTYVKFDNGEVMSIDKVGIDSTVYYPDHLDDPLDSDRKANWKHYNMRNLHDFGVSEWEDMKHDLETIGCCSGRYIEKPYLRIYKNTNGRPNSVNVVFLRGMWDDMENAKENVTIELLSDSEISDIKNFLKEEKDAYEKRLETYWKRYSYKICSYGYWADR